MPQDPIAYQPHAPHVAASPQGVTDRVGGTATPPKAGPLNRLRNAGPKDTIPIVGKSPRKQRSSRFHVTEKVDLEKLPNFNGERAATWEG